MPEASTDTPVKQDAAAEAQAAGGHAHAPHLAHHFDTPGQQYEAATLGMWLFLATEILLFGGMFCAYAVYRANHPDVFAVAHEALSKTLGGVNTVILLCSSFTMATGVWAAERGRQRLLGVMLALTILGGLGFLGIKYVEYKHKWEEGLLWGKYYKPHEHDLAAATQHARIGDHPAPGAAPPDVGAQRPWRETTPGHGTEKTGGEPNAAAGEPNAAGAGQTAWIERPPDSGPGGLVRGPGAPLVLAPERQVRNVRLFFSIYFGMTGLHGLHVVAGLIAIGWLLARATRGDFSRAYFTPVPMVGLYWHVVDLIWIYLFPLLYLIH